MLMFYISLATFREQIVMPYIQGDRKVSVHLMITIQKDTNNFQSVPASFQTFIDKPKYVLENRVQYSTVHIPNVMAIFKSIIVLGL
jgi:hypothetical protein